MDLQKEIDFHQNVPELEEPVRPTEVAKFEEYAQAPDPGRNPLHRFLRHIHEHRPETILELGCGAGQLTTRLAKIGYQVTALELSPELLEATRMRAAMDGVSGRVETWQGDLTQFDCGDRRFDMVVAKLVLHHLDLEAALRMITRSLKPGGVLVVWEPVAFSTALQALRDVTPVKKEVSPNERQLTRADLARIRSCFANCQEDLFYLFARLHRVFPDHHLTRILLRGVECFDAFALANCPPLRHFAGTAVLCLRKPHQEETGTKPAATTVTSLRPANPSVPNHRPSRIPDVPGPAMTRPPDRIRHHYEVEKELADRLRASTREERTALFKTLYTELFSRVPDHPRLARLSSPVELAWNLEAQLRLLRPHLPSQGPKPTLVEFAPGDGRFSAAAAPFCERVFGVDISDQRSPAQSFPENFELIVYDGYHLDLPDASADLAFSYQFLEHLHPDDVATHFALVRRLLKPGGLYVFDTPHRFSGPHDVSAHFGDTLDCFHFQEWTYREMRRQLAACGFGVECLYRRGRAYRAPLARFANEALEDLVGCLPTNWRRRVASRLFQSVNLAARRLS